MSGYALRLGK